MKTSKIKTVVSIKPHKNSYGETFYHNLEMENGDKINIGKKKEQKIGWELTYESFNKSNNYTPSNSSNDDRQLLIVKQSSIKAAVEFDNQCTIEDMLKNAEIIKDWVMGTDVQKKVDKVSKAFNDKFAGTTPDDLPF